MPIKTLPPIHRPPRPPRLRTPPTRPLGPRFLRLGTAPGVQGGPGEPPADFPGPGIQKAHVSKTEWIVYWAIARVLRDPLDPRQPPYHGGTNWDYQIPEGGGREIAGGSVVDYVIRLGNPPFAIRLQTERWHILAPPQIVAKDLQQKINISQKSYNKFIDLYDHEVLGDDTGQKACRAVAKAIRQGQAPSPLLFGTAQRVR